MVGTGAAEARKLLRARRGQCHLLSISAGRCAGQRQRVPRAHRQHVCVHRSHKPDVLSQAGSQRVPRWCPEGDGVSILAIEAPQRGWLCTEDCGSQEAPGTSAAGRSWEGFLQVEAF